MALLTGVFTTRGRATLARSQAQVAGFSNSYATYFKIGMGGYITVAGGRVPKAPDPSKIDIEADGTPGNAYFKKYFVPIDFVDQNGTMQIRCRLEPGEFNDDGTGNPPRLFEIGIFDQNDNLMVYCTFPEQSKAANKLLTNYVQEYF